MAVRDVVQAAAGALGGGGNPNAWDISKAYYDAGADAWNVSTASYVQGFSVTALETAPTGLFFKPDGTKMYVIGSAGDDVNEYTLSVAWNISTASYVQAFSIAAQETGPNAIFFKPDGTKMYVIGINGDDVNEYTLSTAWDVSTASYVQNFSVASYEGEPNGLFFKPDGTKMYVIGSLNANVNEYALSTAWNISTASYLQNFSVYAQEASPQDVFFKPDGTKMYITGYAGDDVNEYDLSTAWDISTASYLQNFSVATQETNPRGVFFKPDGSGFYILGISNDTVCQYNIGGFSVAAQELTPNGLFLKPDGTKMYIIGQNSQAVNEYDLSSAWDIDTASYLQNFSVSSAELVPNDLFFKPDGTKMYITGQNGDEVNEYDLSTAWDISTASYLQNFSVSAQDTAPEGLFFSPDGTKMYITGSNNNVNEYSVSSAWNISTASYVRNFSISAQGTGPSGIHFKPDGTKMYICRQTNSDVEEYSLSTAWNVSTASYIQNFVVSTQASATQGVFFKPDGTQFWIVGSISDKVFSYLISEE